MRTLRSARCRSAPARGTAQARRAPALRRRHAASEPWRLDRAPGVRGSRCRASAASHRLGHCSSHFGIHLSGRTRPLSAPSGSSRRVARSRRGRFVSVVDRHTTAHDGQFDSLMRLRQRSRRRAATPAFGTSDRVIVGAERTRIERRRPSASAAKRRFARRASADLPSADRAAVTDRPPRLSRRQPVRRASTPADRAPTCRIETAVTSSASASASRARRRRLQCRSTRGGTARSTLVWRGPPGAIRDGWSATAIGGELAAQASAAACRARHPSLAGRA